MYVERGMEEIVCLKMEMGLREEEEREFDEFALLCLRLRGREFFFFHRVLVLWEKEIFGFLGFELLFKLKFMGFFFFFLIMPVFF